MKILNCYKVWTCVINSTEGVSEELPTFGVLKKIKLYYLRVIFI